MAKIQNYSIIVDFERQVFVIIIVGFFIQFYGMLSYCAAIDKCPGLVEAREILTFINRSLPSRKTQIENYKKILILLDTCQNEKTPPHVEFEIETLQQTIRNKLKRLESKTAIGSGLKNDWETLYKDCYRMYVQNFDLIRTLSCDEAAKIITDYYDDSWELLKNNGSFRDKTKYSTETIQTLWPLLYRLAQPECAVSKSAKSAIRRVFLPHPMDPEALGHSLSDQMKRDAFSFIPFLDGVEHIGPEQKLGILEGFAEISKQTNSPEINRFLNLLFRLKSSEFNNMEMAISMLSKIPWTIDQSAQKEYAKISGEKVNLLINNFLLLIRGNERIDTSTAGDLAEKVNAAFQAPYSLPKRYAAVSSSPSTPILKKYLSDLTAAKIGKPIKGMSSLKSTRTHDIEVFGKIEPLSADDYVVHIYFVSPDKIFLFSDKIELNIDVLKQVDEIDQKAKTVYERFNMFVTIMQLMDRSESYATVSYLKNEKPAAFIQRAVLAHAPLYELRNNQAWKKVNKIVIHEEFWGANQNADAILGSGYKEMIMKRIESLYYRSYQALISDIKGVPATTLEIYGRYSPPNLNEASPPINKMGKIRIHYSINYDDIALTDLSIPLEIIQSDMIKQIVAQTVCGSIAMFLDFTPERLKVPDPIVIEKPVIQSPAYHPMVSFIMPGIWRNKTENDSENDYGLKIWNYSNFAFLGIALGSSFLYIGNDYENDALFWSAFGGASLFLANGTIGLADAIINGKNSQDDIGNNKKINIHPAVIHGSPSLLFSMQF